MKQQSQRTAARERVWQRDGREKEATKHRVEEKRYRLIYIIFRQRNQ